MPTVLRTSELDCVRFARALHSEIWTEKLSFHGENPSRPPTRKILSADEIKKRSFLIDTTNGATGLKTRNPHKGGCEDFFVIVSKGLCLLLLDVEGECPVFCFYTIRLQCLGIAAPRVCAAYSCHLLVNIQVGVVRLLYLLRMALLLTVFVHITHFVMEGTGRETIV